MVMFEKVSSDADLKKDVKIIKKEFVDLNKYFQKVNEKNSIESPVINFLRQNLNDTTETSPAFEYISKFMKMLSLTPGLNPGAAGAALLGQAWILTESGNKEAFKAKLVGRNELFENAIEKTYHDNKGTSLTELGGQRDVLLRYVKQLYSWTEAVLQAREKDRDLLAAQGRDVETEPYSSGILAEAVGRTNEDLIRDLINSIGELIGIDILYEETKASEALKATKEQSQPQVPRQPVAKLVETSGYENLTAAAKKATQAEENLQTSQTANSTALDNHQANVEAVSEAYSGYTNTILSAADSMNYLALTEENVAQRQNVTAEILNNALNESQTKVDNLAGESLVGLSNAFAGAIAKGESFGEALKSIGENILYTIIQMQALSWITSLFGGSGGMEKFGTFTPSNSILNLSSSSPYGAWGSAISALLPFAKGGIVSKPTIFGFAKGIGLMGEAGAEAIMPLGRDSRGNLGVRVADSAMSGAGSGSVFAPHVEINVENKGGGDMSEEQARTLGTQVKAIVEMQVAKQMYEYMRNGTLRPSMGRGY